MDVPPCVDLHAIPKKQVRARLLHEIVSTTHPSDPGTTLGAKCDLPRRLKRLEVFIWLEESLDRQRVDDSERQESAEDEQPLRVARHFCSAVRSAEFLDGSHDFV